jgi:thioredoxin reductase (NADPH)
MLLVDADAIASGALAAVLLRRFGSDYRVMTTDSWEAGVSALTELAEHGEAVALVAVDLYLPGVDAVAFLAQARTLHPQAMRALLARMDQRGTRIPFVALEQLRRATALG